MILYDSALQWSQGLVSSTIFDALDRQRLCLGTINNFFCVCSKATCMFFITKIDMPSFINGLSHESTFYNGC